LTQTSRIKFFAHNGSVEENFKYQLLPTYAFSDQELQQTSI